MKTCKRLLRSTLLLLGLLASVASYAQQAQAVRIRITTPDSTLTVSLDSAAYVKAFVFNEAVYRSFSGQFLIELGYANADYSGLNPVLAQLGYPQLPANYFTYGVGGTVRLNHVMLALESVSFDFKETSQQRRTELTNSTALMRLGYCLFDRNYRQCLIPSLGIRLSDSNLILTDVNGTATLNNTTSLLTAPSYSRTLNYQNVGLLLGLGYEFFPFDATVLKRNVIGLHAGYALNLGDGKYYTSDIKQPVEGPALNPLRFTARLVFGFVL